MKKILITLASIVLLQIVHTGSVHADGPTDEVIMKNILRDPIVRAAIGEIRSHHDTKTCSYYLDRPYIFGPTGELDFRYSCPMADGRMEAGNADVPVTRGFVAVMRDDTGKPIKIESINYGIR